MLLAGEMLKAFWVLTPPPPPQKELKTREMFKILKNLKVDPQFVFLFLWGGGQDPETLNMFNTCPVRSILCGHIL